MAPTEASTYPIAKLKALLLHIRALATAHHEARAAGVEGDGTVEQLDELIRDIERLTASLNDSKRVPTRGGIFTLYSKPSSDWAADWNLDSPLSQELKELCDIYMRGLQI